MCGPQPFGDTIIPRNIAIKRAVISVIGVILFFIFFYGFIDTPKKQAVCRLYHNELTGKYKVKYWNKSQKIWMDMNTYDKLKHAIGAMEVCVNTMNPIEKPEIHWKLMREEF